MSNVRNQLFSALKEAMTRRKVTVGQMSAEMGSHYTYIYNTLRNRPNLTIDSAERFCDAVGYDMNITLTPKEGSGAPLLNYDFPADGDIYSGRKLTAPKSGTRKIEVTDKDPTVVGPTDAYVPTNDAGLDPELDAELDALLGSGA